MSKISKELIESYRKIVLPFVSNQLCKAYFEGQGEIDKTEFEQDFNEILNLAISSLNPSKDAISRSVLKDLISDKSIPIKFEAEKRGEWLCALGMPLGDIYTAIDNAPKVDIKDQIAGAYNEGYMCGNKEAEKARPQGEWIPKRLWDNTHIWVCSECGNQNKHGITVEKACWKCGAKMKGGAENV